MLDTNPDTITVYGDKYPSKRWVATNKLRKLKSKRYGTVCYQQMFLEEQRTLGQYPGYQTTGKIKWRDIDDLKMPTIDWDAITLD